MNATNAIINWSKAQAVARQIRSVQREYIGCEVIEQLPSGEYAVAVITHMSWQENEWYVGIRYLSNGMQSWTMGQALILTGLKYPDIDAVVKCNPICESVWR